MLTYGERRFINRRSCWPLHTYGDHRLRTWRSPFHRPAIMLTLYNFSNLRLHTYGEHRFFDRRSCWPMENAASSTGDHVDLYIPSATTDYARMDIAVSSSTTTDYARMEIVVSSTGGHVDLCITSTTTDYAHMEIAVSSTGDHVDLV